MADGLLYLPPLVEPVLSGLFHSLAGKGRVDGREGKVNDAEVGGT